MQSEGGSLEARLARFLFSYRATSQTMTEVSPAELMMGHRLRSKLDLLHPDLASKVKDKQTLQKACTARPS